MFVPTLWREDRLAHSLPQKYGKYLQPKQSLTLQQVQQLCFKPGYYTYEILLTIDPKKFMHLKSFDNTTKINIISTFLEQFRYNVYGVFEAPINRPTNLHFHGVIAIPHKNYDKMIKYIKTKFLKLYWQTIGKYSLIRINSSTEDYKPTDLVSNFGSKRTIGSFKNYYNYINKSLTDSQNTYHNTLIQNI